MKNLFYLFVLAIILASCSKDKIVEQQSNDNKNEIKLVTLSDGSKTGVTLLEFTSVEHFEAAITSLETQMEQHVGAFVTTWSNLSDEDLESKETEVGFVDHQPLVDFENAYNVPSSLRQVFYAAEEQWLNNEELVPENSPSLVYPFGMAELTLLNSDGMVKIGDKIIQLTKKGFVQIANLDIATVIRIKNGDMTALNEPTVTTNIELDNGGGKSGTDCSRWAAKEDYKYYDYNNKKVKRHVHFHSYPWKGVSEADITSYKKKNGSWKRHKTNLGVADQSYFRDNDCNSSLSGWSGWKRKKRESISERVASWGAFPQYRAENGVSVIGYFEYPGYSNSLVLTW